MPRITVSQDETAWFRVPGLLFAWAHVPQVTVHTRRIGWQKTQGRHRQSTSRQGGDFKKEEGVREALL